MNAEAILGINPFASLLQEHPHNAIPGWTLNLMGQPGNRLRDPNMTQVKDFSSAAQYRILFASEQPKSRPSNQIIISTLRGHIFELYFQDHDPDWWLRVPIGDTMRDVQLALQRVFNDFQYPDDIDNVNVPIQWAKRHGYATVHPMTQGTRPCRSRATPTQ